MLKFVHYPSRQVQRYGWLHSRWNPNGNATNHDAELGEKDSERTLLNSTQFIKYVLLHEEEIYQQVNQNYTSW